MTVTGRSLGIDKFELDDRPTLVAWISETVCVDAQQFSLSESQRAELDRCIADDDGFPDDIVPWDDIKVSVRARLRQ